MVIFTGKLRKVEFTTELRVEICVAPLSLSCLTTLVGNKLLEKLNGKLAPSNIKLLGLILPF